MSNVRRATVLLLLAPVLAGALVCSSFGLTANGNALAARSTANADPPTPVDLGLPNPSFAEGLQHWDAVVSGAGSVRATDRGHRDRSGAVLEGTASSPRATILSSAVALPLSTRGADGTKVRFAIWVRTTQPRTAVALTLHARDGSSLREVGSRTYSTRHTGWRRVAMTRKVGTSVSTVQASVGATDLSRSRRVRLDGAVLVGRQALSAETTPYPTPTPTPDWNPDPEPGGTYASGHTWKSGASGQTVANGSFANWRGSKLDIVGTWSDSQEAQTAQWSLEEYNHWQGDVDNAIGAIFGGESWSAAANGRYDARWTTALKKVNALRAGKPGVVYLRFAHEFNGDWYPWSVNNGNVADFVKAWRRFHALFQQHMDPRHKLVWSPNWDTTGSLDVRSAWPGARYVDVISPDYYNQWPYNSTRASWWSTMTSRESNGAPQGMETWRQFAEQQGVPFGVSEWGDRAPSSGASGGGDNPGFMEFMHGWFEQHAGTGPGKVLFEVYFNVNGFGEGQFEIYPGTQMPKAAARYRELW